jgi:MFS family permease
MTTTTDDRQRQAAEGSPGKLKTSLAAGVGTCVENYDFIAYGTASALYFGKAFFPHSDPVVGTLLSFATFGVGFLMRPLGGAIGGYIGDRYGRKPVLVGALLVMGIATVLIGALPTYGQVGVLAPILLVTIRVIQGLAFGSEWGGAIMMAYEHAPWKRRGLFAAIPQAGNYLGIALATLAFLASRSLGNDLSWRIPFLLSSVLIVVGMVVRLQLSESPEFKEAKAEGTIVKNPFLTVVRKDWRNILRVIALRIVESCVYYTTATYVLSYIKAKNPENSNFALAGLLIAAVLAIGVAVLAGSLTDRVGRRTLYLVGCILVIAYGFPMFLMANTGSPFLVICIFIIGVGVIHANFTGIQGSWLAELFPTNTRTSGASIGYQVAASIAGFSPFIALLLASRFGWAGPALFYELVGVIGLIGVLATRETWGPQQRAEVDAIIDGRRSTTG